MTDIRTIPVPHIDWMDAAWDYWPFGWLSIGGFCECGQYVVHIVPVNVECVFGCSACGCESVEYVPAVPGMQSDGQWLMSYKPVTLMSEIQGAG